MIEDDINDYMPSILNPRAVKKENWDFNVSQIQALFCGSQIYKKLEHTCFACFHHQWSFWWWKHAKQNSVTSRISLSLRKNNRILKCRAQDQARIKALPANKENSQNYQNATNINTVKISQSNDLSLASLNKNVKSAEGCFEFLSFEDTASVNLNPRFSLPPSTAVNNTNLDHGVYESKATGVKSNESYISVSSATEIVDSGSDAKSEKTVVYEVNEPTVTVSFGVNDCTCVDVSTNNSNIKRVHVSHENNNTNVDCEIVENAELSFTTSSDHEESMNESAHSPPKKLAVAVKIDIKKKKLTDDTSENLKVLILNTDAIEKLSHVIVQPPNYKLVKRNILAQTKIKGGSKKKSVIRSSVKNGKQGKPLRSDRLKQKPIHSYFKTNLNALSVGAERTLVDNSDDNVYGTNLDRDDVRDMSKNSSIADGVKFDRARANKGKDNESPKSFRVPSVRTEFRVPVRQDIKTSSSDAQRTIPPTSKNDCISSPSHSPRKKYESIQFSLPSKSKMNKSSVTPRNIPHHKIVAGTHFAVDAFAYGEISNVKHYFLTHFHSDHYTGLKKSFNKELYCSKITSVLCMTRLGVRSECIHVLNPDETVRIEGVDVTAVDANHCPGAVMLLFALPNGKNMLHCGDFRACPAMESYPIFWNKDIHTVYLDTTYCNPRYDFPTQDQSLEMAMYILRQKKLDVEKAGKKFSSVLIVCGTYTIGKEKFFLGIARRVDCSVWAFPEKDRVLQAVEGRSFSHASPQTCQLHVLAMRDLTYEKLKSYLDSLQGAFSEVVAFKPSGWENGKNATVEKDNVTIHGIPYSEHSSFSELIRFVKFLKPKQVVPTVDISGGIKAVQKYFPCPLIYKDEHQSQSKLTDFFCALNRPQGTAVT